MKITLPIQQTSARNFSSDKIFLIAHFEVHFGKMGKARTSDSGDSNSLNKEKNMSDNPKTKDNV